MVGSGDGLGSNENGTVDADLRTSISRLWHGHPRPAAWRSAAHAVFIYARMKAVRYGLIPLRDL
jgi:hypothetical protein